MSKEATTLAEISEVTMAAWVDAGYMSPALYDQEIERRREQEKKEVKS